METFSAMEIRARLAGAGVLPTLQRMAVASVLLRQPVHMTAEQVLEAARAVLPDIARATVYSVLRLFVRSGLIKELPLEGAAAVYDSNVSPHHHLYNLDTGEVSDLPAGRLQVVGLADLGDDLALAEVDVIVRVRGKHGVPARSPAA